MSQLNDLNCNCAARRVLVRHWINLGKASLRTTNGVLSVHGTLEKLPGGGELTPSGVCELAAELRRIGSVRRVCMSFTNWIETEGTWRLADKNPPALITMRKRPAPGGVFEINES